MSLNKDGRNEPLLPSYQSGSSTYGSTEPNVGMAGADSMYNNNNSNAVQVIHATPPEGLSTEEANRRRGVFGRNELPDNEESKLWKFLMGFTGPMPVREPCTPRF